MRNHSMDLNIVAIIQARMSSSRLPGKVLLDLAGQPMLMWVVERVRLANLVSNTVVATTTDPADDTIANFCNSREIPCFRGSLPDVLDRYYRAAQAFHAEHIVRITGDCPLIDPQLIDTAIMALVGDKERDIPGCDFIANRLPPPWKRTYPIGLDTEACTMSALARAWREAGQSFQREHVMPYFYDDIPGSSAQLELSLPLTRIDTPRGFHIGLLNTDRDFGALRWTVDTAVDLQLLRLICSNFKERRDFSWLEVLAFMEQHPDLAQINQEVQSKTLYQVDERHSP